MRKKSILCLLLCAVLLTPFASFAVGESGQAAEDILQESLATTFAVIQTGDTNGVTEYSENAVGFARTSALADETAQDYDTLLLDSGNALSGDGRKTIEILNAAGYTAACIGTRDAALGIDQLQTLSAVADFPLLCANWLEMTGDLLFDPYTIVQVGNLQVGIIGLISPDILEDYPEETEGCNVYKPSAIANIYYEEMSEAGCNYYIALTSLGYDGSFTPQDLAEDCPWLNLILDSNTGDVLDMGELVDGTNVIVFNVEPDFAQVARLVVTAGTSSGQNTTLPEVITAENVKNLSENSTVAEIIDTPESELIPSEEETDAEDAQETTEEGTVTVTTTGGSNLLLFLLSFAAIAAAVVVVVVIMTRKDKKKTAEK